jgi:hypothetical protein
MMFLSHHFPVKKQFSEIAVVCAASLLSLAMQDPHMYRRVQFIETGCNPDVDYNSLRSLCLFVKVYSFHLKYSQVSYSVTSCSSA